VGRTGRAIVGCVCPGKLFSWSGSDVRARRATAVGERMFGSFFALPGADAVYVSDLQEARCMSRIWWGLYQLTHANSFGRELGCIMRQQPPLWMFRYTGFIPVPQLDCIVLLSTQRCCFPIMSFSFVSLFLEASSSNLSQFITLERPFFTCDVVYPVYVLPFTCWREDLSSF